MRIINCKQQTEEWDQWRNRPTASEFGSFITPAKGDYSTQASKYAAKIVCKRLGVYTEPVPSGWMEWGTEQEPNAKLAYTKETGRAITDVGFVLPDGTDAYGGSPDGLVGDDGIIEIKCPKPETLVAYKAAEKLPVQYRPQVQGLMLITGRQWCDFYVFHPQLKPFLLRVEEDIAYQTRIAECLRTLLHEIEGIEGKSGRMRHELISHGDDALEVPYEDHR